MFSTNQDGHSFWSSNSVMDTDCDGIIQPGGSANLRTRVIEFTGKFERVDRQCRALLPSGRLCPREDRFKVNLKKKKKREHSFNRFSFTSIYSVRFMGASYPETHSVEPSTPKTK